MCEIVIGNFEAELPTIVDAIRRASFVAIDTEFTGIELSLQDKVSLFDSPKERYDKLRKNASSFIICQIGISAYVKDDTKNKYNAYTYNFYICPRSRGVIDSLFSCQASSFEFLAHHKFDFNKWVYEGLPFLRYDQEDDLRERLRNRSLFSSMKRTVVDDYVVQSCCSQVAEWLSGKPRDGEELALTVKAVVSDYIIHKEMRIRYAEIWTYGNNNKNVVVKKVSAQERQHLELAEDDLDERLVDDFLGFTRIFKALVRSKKPLVGHNLLTDLLLMYNLFYKPLPKSYDKFKCEITDLFPKIYDTKHISSCMRKIFEDSDIFNSTTLGELFVALDSHQGRFHALYSPEISHPEGFTRYACGTPLHEAGYDAYLAGYVFIRMAHMYSWKDKTSEKHCALPFAKYLKIMTPFVNSINLIRANLAYLNLSSSDPKSSRPHWLVIESTSDQLVDTTQIIDVCSQYGSVDVKLLDPRRALVAAMNFMTARGIIKAYGQDKDVRVSSYSAIKHSKLCRFYLWASAVLSATIGTTLLITVGRNGKLL